MPNDCDIVIAGAGLAGACAAYFLSRTHRVVLLEAGEPASGASGVPAGTANPLMSLWARPVWRMEEAMAALDELIGALDAEWLVRRDGLLRPAADGRQSDAFERVSREFPDHATWYPAEASAERFPDVRAPFGALWNGTALTVPIPGLVHALLDASAEQGAIIRSGTVLMDWHDADSERVRATIGRSGERGSTAEELTADHLILALGRDYHDFEPLAGLRLHQVKGQLVRVARPPGLDRLPNLAGRGYVMVEPDALLLGSTYEHRFCDLQPDPDKTRQIVETTAEMVPAIRDFPVLEERVGVRVTVPGIRLPMVGPVPGHPRVWVFTGLGSKGLLMAPLVGKALGDYLTSPGSIPGEIKVRTLERA